MIQFDLQHSHISPCFQDTYVLLPDGRNATCISAPEDYFNAVLGLDSEPTWERFGTFKWEIAGCLFFSWVIICLSLIKGVQVGFMQVYLPY